MSDFTPGPWRIQKEALPGRFGITAENGRFITWAMGEGSDKQGTANARLIAAAPTLHDTLAELTRLSSDLIKAVLLKDGREMLLAANEVNNLLPTALGILAKVRDEA